MTETVREGPREAASLMHIQQGALDESLRSLSSSALQGLDVRDAIARVVDATRTIFEVEGAGLMLVDPESVLRYVVSTDPAAAALEQAQEDTGAGPCVDSLVLDRVVRTVDVTIDDRWPEIHDRLAEAGVRAVLGLPIAVAHTTVGSLNVYRPEPYEWDDSDEQALQTYGSLIEDVMTSGLLWSAAARSSSSSRGRWSGASRSTGRSGSSWAPRGSAPRRRSPACAVSPATAGSAPSSWPKRCSTRGGSTPDPSSPDPRTRTLEPGPRTRTPNPDPEPGDSTYRESSL